MLLFLLVCLWWQPFDKFRDHRSGLETTVLPVTDNGAGWAEIVEIELERALREGWPFDRLRDHTSKSQGP